MFMEYSKEQVLEAIQLEHVDIGWTLLIWLQLKRNRQGGKMSIKCDRCGKRLIDAIIKWASYTASIAQSIANSLHI
jgi:hypothetical protein